MKGRVKLTAAGVAVAVLGAGLSIALDDSSSSVVAEPLPGEKWRDGVLSDLALMSQGTLDYVRVFNDWRNGNARPGEFAGAATRTMDKYLEARELLSHRVAFEPAPRALLDYRDTLQIFLAHTRVAKAASRVADRDLRLQVQLLLGRLRVLADRVYDLGNDEMNPFIFHSGEVSGFEYLRPADVPSFAGSDLAPGRPLSSPATTSSPAREYEQARPEQAWSVWATTVQAAGIPGPEGITSAITRGNLATLDRLAIRLTAASDRIHASPDPKGERELSSRLQLGLLVQAEAARVAQLSRLVPHHRAEVKEVAEVLALIGNNMWDDRLGQRALGFPAELLVTRPTAAPLPYSDPRRTSTPRPRPAS